MNKEQEFMATKMIAIMGQGNPGAMSAIMELAKDQEIGDLVLKFCAEHKIFGTHLYVFWSDICDRDVKYMAYLIENAKKKDIIDFSFKQDYSGRQYFNEYKERYYEDDNDYIEPPSDYI